MAIVEVSSSTSSDVFEPAAGIPKAESSSDKELSRLALADFVLELEEESRLEPVDVRIDPVSQSESDASELSFSLINSESLRGSGNWNSGGDRSPTLDPGKDT